MTAPVEWITVHTDDGRDIEALVTGPTDGRLLVFHDGTPTAASPFPQLTEPAAERGLRTVIFSRPGYGRSTPLPGRTVADVAPDTESIVRALTEEGFVTIGWSGGGPHALACAALLPQRCLATATLASVAPYGSEGLDWLQGMGPENIEEFAATVAGEQALTRYLEGEAPGMASVTGREISQALGGLVSDVDKAALTGAFAETVAESFRRAVSSGIAGWRDDDLAFARPWGFELGRIETPVSIWQGGQDRMVPYSHGSWLEAHVPGARAHLYEDEGHLSLISHIDLVIDDLLNLASEGSRG